MSSVTFTEVGPGAFLTAADLTKGVSRVCDVVIVGSGAGGAVLAAGLVARGASVIVLEEGSRVTRRELTLQEGDAYPQLYQERGTRSTADTAISVLQGRGVGGSTMVNWTTCFRTPDRILAHWQRVHGLDALTTDALAPHFEAVESRLSIATWPEAMANANNRVLLEGARALGWEAGPLRRNVRGCANSGFCGVGCPVDGKQAMGITYLADAVAGGAQVMANVSVREILREGGKAVGVVGRVMSPGAGEPDGARVEIRARAVVVAGGAINSPALLLRSGIAADGRVGRRTFLHPVIGMFGRRAERVDPFFGAPQSAGSHHLIDRGPDRVGFFFEAVPLQPMLAAVAFPGFGRGLTEPMQQLPHAVATIALSVDGLLPEDDGGTVILKGDGRPSLDYPVRPFLTEAFQAAHEAIAQVQLAGGCELSASLHHEPVVVRGPDDLPRLRAAPYGAHEHAIFSAHQMGGCTMSATAERGVVDPEHRVWGVPGLYVVDGSVLPTALGVNPSETIYGLAHRAVGFVLAGL